MKYAIEKFRNIAMVKFKESVSNRFQSADVDGDQHYSNQKVRESIPGESFVNGSVQNEFPDAHVQGVEEPRTVPVGLEL